MLLTMVMVITMLPAATLTAYADTPVPYLAWDEASKTIKDVAGGCGTYTELTETTDSWTDGIWYVASDNVTIGERINVSGTVNLILRDSAVLTAGKGISVTSGSVLNIYAQSTGENTGKLIATGVENAAGIGGNKSDCGNITIHGGNVTATGGDYGAGIGGGFKGGSGSVTIHGGIVNATGGWLGAGIGGGNGSSTTSFTVTISDGIVTANSGGSAAGIGGGRSSNGCQVIINGGNVTANGLSGAVGIQ